MNNTSQKNAFRRLMLPFVGLALAATVNAATFSTGNTIDFQSTDFIDGSATKSWVISTGSTDTTSLWNESGMVFSGNGVTMSSSFATGGFVEWKITVPDTDAITSFTWAVRQVILAGAISPAGDDSFEWQYSTDGVNYTTFFSRANRLSTDTGGSTQLNNDVFMVTLPESIVSSALYIRATTIEGTAISGDSGYYKVSSSTASTGGSDANSYITIGVQAIPEPASMAAIMGAFVVMLALVKRRGRQ